MKIDVAITAARQRSSMRERGALIACVLLFCATIAAYAGLLPAGHWQDEYYTFYRFRDDGLPYLFERILTWSPRPLSEALVYLYGVTVVKTGRPLIGTVLGMIWAATALAITVVPVVCAARRDRVVVAVAGLALLALFLTNHPTGEMYYWPQASLAYMPALAAICALFWLCIATGLESVRARSAAAVVLTVAACSIEIGAMFVFVLTGLVVAVNAWAPRVRVGWRHAAWLVMPLVASAGVLALAAHGRVSNGNEVMGSPLIAHHLKSALLAAIPEFSKALALSNWSEHSRFGIALSIASKILVFGAFAGLSQRLSSLRARPRAARWLAILSVACISTVFLTIVAAYFQFGMLCCERHDTLRQCLIYIAIVAAGSVVGLSLNQVRGPVLSLCMLFAAVAINASMSLGALRSDYTRLDEFRSVKVANWNHGTAQSPTMEFEQIAPGQIVGGVLIENKTYKVQDPSIGWWVEGVLKFFHKTEATFKTH